MRVASIGECMIEIVRASDGASGFGYAGDTFNTAIYMARCGLQPSYVTALGSDPFSDGMLAKCAEEGIDTRLIARRADKLPGIYIVSTDAKGERQFHYWRNDSAARTLFLRQEDDATLAALDDFAVVYWSGITLAILATEARQRLFAALKRIRSKGVRVAFDCNFRARLWPDMAAARAAYLEALGHADISLTALEDEKLAFGGDEADLAARHAKTGVAEIVIKNANPGSRVVIPAAGIDICTDAPPVAKVVDTTAAGDSFAAAYLAGRLRGDSPDIAAAHGHRLAGSVVGVRGAILPRDAMPALG